MFVAIAPVFPFSATAAVFFVTAVFDPAVTTCGEVDVFFSPAAPEAAAVAVLVSAFFFSVFFLASSFFSVVFEEAVVAGDALEAVSAKETLPKAPLMTRDAISVTIIFLAFMF